MAQPSVQRLRVLRRRPPRGPKCRAQHHRHFPRSAGHVVNLGRLVHQLIHRQRQKIPKHDVHNGPQAGHRRAHAHSRESRLRNWRIKNALRPKFFHQSGQHLEGCSRLRHVFSKNAHARIAPHLLRKRFADRLRKCQFPDRCFRHKRPGRPPRHPDTERRWQTQPRSSSLRALRPQFFAARSHRPASARPAIPPCS